MRAGDIIARVRLMEKYFDRVRMAFDCAPDSVFTDKKLRHMRSALIDYMDGGMWQKDYHADEEGMLPVGMKRGVLSEDGLYDLLTEIWEYGREAKMERILFVNACVREDSRTLRLAKYALDRMSGEMTEVRLNDEGILPLNSVSLSQRDSIIARGDMDAPMLRYAREFADADRIVVAAPYWDLTFPALLKAYLEHVTVTGVTFRYEEGIPVGMCKAKRLIYITTAGGPMFVNYGYDYMKTLANVFYGIHDTHIFKSENLDVYGADVEDILKNTEAEIAGFFAE